MNTRLTTVVLVCSGVLASAYVLAQTLAPGKKYPLSFKITVVDDEGTPIEECEVKTSTYTRFQPGQGFGKEIWEGPRSVTDDEGEVSFEYDSQNGAIRYSAITPSGYYATEAQEYQFEPVKDDLWQPENHSLRIVLKRIVNPIPMYARRAGHNFGTPLTIPALDEPVGYDLVESDWVTPFGKGTTSDLIFSLNSRYVSPEDFDATLTVAFSNAGDGIQEYTAHPHKGSQLRLPHHAPKDGYLPQIIRTRSSNPKDTAETRVRETQNYIFRVRTILDSQGKVVSTHYGKIHGDFNFWANQKMRMAHYINPTPNDTNLEFDPKQNLLGKLASTERVTAP